jgi:hypothetical protein
VAVNSQAKTYPAGPKPGGKGRWWAVAAATVAMFALCGSCLADADAETADPVTRPPARAVATSRPAVTESPTPEPSESAEPEPSQSPSPEPTATESEAGGEVLDCVRRGRLSAAVKYFGDDPDEWCELLPSYDFGVTVKQYDRCVANARRYHVEKWYYESVCRYDHTRRWSQTDDPNYDPYPDDNSDSDSDAGEVDDGNDPTGGDTGDTGGGGYDEGDGHSGCTWVNSYYRKDGTHVRGYWRC